jgi:hypothetical protein
MSHDTSDLEQTRAPTTFEELRLVVQEICEMKAEAMLPLDRFLDRAAPMNSEHRAS